MAYKGHEGAAAIKIAGNFGKEQIMDDADIPSFLGDILPISLAADEVEESNPRVAYIYDQMLSIRVSVNLQNLKMRRRGGYRKLEAV
ncbi:hypothetical protein L2E82_29946 [Cichorium intybus]|uniref:Uncharacterized protein n=1 Tax=Cichorium intybus TaxID=13427 RepID=A0ACB9CYV9_CICIN|nr:hypothetical protein L2E82_29946 [Cichorium intybus]